MNKRILAYAVIILSVVYFYGSESYASDEWTYEYCTISANSAGAYLQDRFDGMTLSEVIEAERIRLSSRKRKLAPGISQEEAVNRILKMNMPEILAAFDQRYSDTPSEQTKIKRHFVDQFLSNCLKENLR
jgi:hypothetical protein